MDKVTQFDFGQNWKSFSENALDNEKVLDAKKHFRELFEGVDFANKNFLDIGFGQGLGLLMAQELGANCTGNDINPKCKEALLASAKKYNNSDIDKISIVIGSILDKQTISELESCRKKYDIVQSWGVLHHTGNMYKAITNAASFVESKGYFTIAIYKKHWTSVPWKLIKWFYCKSPSFVKFLLVWSILPLKWLGAFITTGKNPAVKDRGMNYYHDIVDWVGGYPYEYATKEEINDYVAKLGFTLVKFIEVPGFTGCNQFVFQKR